MNNFARKYLALYGKRNDDYQGGREDYYSRSYPITNSNMYRNYGGDYEYERNYNQPYNQQYSRMRREDDYYSNDMMRREDYRTMHKSNDYGQQDMDAELKLTSKELKKWKKDVGEKFKLEEILPVAQQMNIKFNEFSEDEFCTTVNMLYSDYSKILGNDVHNYVAMAKSFLNDDDFDGTGSEKLALYYKCIACSE